MRIGRGHRHFRDVRLEAQAARLLRRTWVNRHHGKPFASISTEVQLREQLHERLAVLNGLHKTTRRYRNYAKLRSANDGITGVIKDNIATTSLPTSCASIALRGFQPAEDSTVSRLLREAGMPLLAKTNMDEFGMGSHSTHSAYGPVRNGKLGREETLSVGGSSGGSALAVAQELAHVGIGTDTGGSVRLPAAYMSLFGFKPSYGMISRLGVIPYANSLDTVGILARTAKDLYWTYDVLSRPDPRDLTCLGKKSRLRVKRSKNKRRRETLGTKLHVRHVPRPTYSEKLWYEPPGQMSTNDLRHASPSEPFVGLDRPIASRRQRRGTSLIFEEQSAYRHRIGVPLEYNITELHPLVRWSWTATLSHLYNIHGFEIVPISLPSTKHALSAYYILALAEASSNLSKYDGVRYGAPRNASQQTTLDEDGALYSSHRYRSLGEEVRRRILLGTYTLSAAAKDNYFTQAQKIRRLVQNDFNSVFRMQHPLLPPSKDTPSNSEGVDLIVVPTAPAPPPFINNLSSQSPVSKYTTDIFTVPASLAGLPAISFPAPPHPSIAYNPEVAIGMQVIGQYGDDYSVLAAVEQYLSDFHEERRLAEKRLVKWKGSGFEHGLGQRWKR
jgi:aspartyl-tRNA(Asn)/glutamyl-tRNA(Gln) amidotransferase subunit A